MSKSTNKTLVGAFVVGALTLLVAALMIFGSGKFFSSSYEFVLFFDGSISGLKVGSPVVFRGVPVGQVSRILLTGNVDSMQIRTPVYIKINEADDGDDESGTGVLNDDFYSDAFLKKMYAHGLRARLSPQSLLTGQLMVDLDFHPAEELGRPITQVVYYNDIPEIPTIPSRFDTILHTLANVPLDTIANNVLQITDTIKSTLQQGNLDRMLAHFDQLVKTTSTTMLHAQEVVGSLKGLTSSYTLLADQTSNNLGEAFQKTGTLLTNLDSVVRNLNVVLTDMRGVVSPTSLPMVELTRAMREISEAARSVRTFANMLDRNPEALLRGKGTR